MKRSAVGSLLRSTQAYCQQVCEKQTLEQGIAYSSEEFPQKPAVQQYREVIAQTPDTLPSALTEAQDHFSELGRQFHVWAPAEGHATEETASFLMERGFVRRAFAAMVLADWKNLGQYEYARILPARPMRAALRASFGETTDADLCELRLDDPQYDMFVAVQNGHVVGRCALYQVGDIARVMDLYVAPSNEYDDIERALLGHVLALSRRLEMRHICTLTPADDQTTIQRFANAGFVQDGEIVEFHRAASPQADGTQ